MKRITIFSKFLLSYVLVLMLPIVITSALLYRSYANAFNEEILVKNYDMLEQLKDTVDDNIEKMLEISLQIRYNPDLSYSKVTEDVLGAMNAVENIANYSLTRNFVYDFFVYYRRRQYLYSASGTYTYPYFINHIYKFEEWSEDSFYITTNTASAPMVRAVNTVFSIDENTYRFLVYIVPIPHDGTTPYATVFFFIEESALHSMLRDIVRKHDGNIIILDNDANVITYLKEKQYMTSGEFRELVEADQDFLAREAKFDDGTYHISSLGSDTSGWRYTIVIPNGKLVERSYALVRQSLVSIVIIFLLGSVIIYFLMHANYTPIKKLKELTKRFWDKDIDSAGEFESIFSTFKYLSDTAFSLQEEIDRTKPAIKNEILSKLINGHYQDEEELRSAYARYGLSVTGFYYFVAIIMFIDTTGVDSLESIIRDIDKIYDADFKSYTKENENGVVTSVFTSSLNDHGAIKNKIVRIKEYLKVTWNLDAAIGVGNAYDSVHDVSKSYIEASSAVNYRMVKGNNAIIWFSEISVERQLEEIYPKGLLAQFRQALLQGNIDTIDGSLVSITCHLKDGSIPLSIVKLICFDVISTIVEVIDRFGESLIDVSYPDVVSLSQFETVEELSLSIHTICSEICNSLQSVRGYKKQIAEVVTYIDSSYEDYNLTAKSVASYFQLPLSTISHHFKDHTGHNISDYINHLRMERAKRLLESTEEPLGEVAVKVGYANDSSFIRRFKQKTGITPGYYRKLYKRS